MSLQVAAITSPSPAAAEHSVRLRGHYSAVEGPSRASQGYRKVHSAIQDAVRDLPREPEPAPHWSHVEHVKRMIF
jgi:hypothetical protein